MKIIRSDLITCFESVRNSGARIRCLTHTMYLYPFHFPRMRETKFQNENIKLLDEKFLSRF